LQTRQVRYGRRKPEQGGRAHGLRPDRTRASRRSLSENRTPEARRCPLGSRSPGVEQNGSGRAGQRGLRKSPAEARCRQGQTRERRIEVVASPTLVAFFLRQGGVWTSGAPVPSSQISPS